MSLSLLPGCTKLPLHHVTSSSRSRVTLCVATRAHMRLALPPSSMALASSPAISGRPVSWIPVPSVCQCDVKRALNGRCCPNGTDTSRTLNGCGTGCSSETVRRRRQAGSRSHKPRPRRQRPVSFLFDLPGACHNKQQSDFCHGNIDATALHSMTAQSGNLHNCFSSSAKRMSSATATIALATSAASLMLLMPLVEWPNQALAAEMPSAQEADVAAPEFRRSLVIEPAEVVPPAEHREFVDTLDNLGFLPVNVDVTSPSIDDATKLPTKDIRMESSQSDEPVESVLQNVQAGGSSAEVFTAGEASRRDGQVLDDKEIPFPGGPTPNGMMTAHTIPAAPAIYSTPAPPLARPADQMSNGPVAANLMVPVAASAAALSAISPATLIVDAAVSAQSVAASAAASVSAATEAVVLATEPVVASAAAATEAVATAAASVAEPVVASAAAAATSGSASLSSKLSLVLAQSIQHLGVGGVAGAVGASVVYPLDTVKTRMQAQSKSSKGQVVGEAEGPCPVDGPESSDCIEGSISCQPGASAPEAYKNEMDCLVRMVKEEGLPSLYSGIGAQLVGIAPEKAVKLTVNEVLLALLESVLPSTRVWLLELIAGGGGGACQVVFTNPVEAVKVRMQTGQKTQTKCVSAEDKGTTERQSQLDPLAGALFSSQRCAEVGTPRSYRSKNVQPRHPSTLEVVKDLGLRGLYTGSALTLARDVPSTALFFACYAFLTQPEQQESFLAATGVSTPVYIFLAACASSIPSAILVTPFDVIKTRMQVMSPSVAESPSAWDVATRLVQDEGSTALFKGAAARALRVGPQLGITLMTYQWLCDKWT